MALKKRRFMGEQSDLELRSHVNFFESAKIVQRNVCLMFHYELMKGLLC